MRPVRAARVPVADQRDAQFGLGSGITQVASLDASKVWHVDLEHSAGDLFALENQSPRLSDDDVARVTKLGGGSPHLDRARHERLAAYIALRLAIERAHEADGHSPLALRRVALVRSPDGRPSLPGFDGDFSLSHVEGHALIGVARRGSIGVDIERPRVVRMDARRRTLIEACATHLSARDPLPSGGDTRFLAAWVRLEAFAKARHITIARLLTAIGALGGSTTRQDPCDASDGFNVDFVGGVEVRDLVMPGGLVAAWARSNAGANQSVN